MKEKHCEVVVYSFHSPALPKLNRNLTDVEVNEVFRLVRNKRTERPADDAVPRRVVLLIELLLDVSRDVLLDVETIQSLRRNVDCISLHLIRHVHILHDSAAILGHWYNEVIPTDMSDFSEKVDEGSEKQTDLKLRYSFSRGTFGQYLSQPSIKRPEIEKHSVRTVPMKVIGILLATRASRALRPSIAGGILCITRSTAH
jgi:hypothetical protein